MQTHPLVVGLALATVLAAQNTLVSPLPAASFEGDSNNGMPFGQPFPARYMQIHADLGTAPRVITKIGFRVDAPTSPATFAGTTTVDIQLAMGHGVPTAQAVPSLTLDANYAAPKQIVLPRCLVTLGPTGAAVVGGPNPFLPELEIMLATPFAYSGAAPLIWEVEYYGSTTVGSMSALDADISPHTPASWTTTGIVGCGPMTHVFDVFDTMGTLVMTTTVDGAPAHALTLLSIGFANPNVPVPGLLCGHLFTDGSILRFLGVTNAIGQFWSNQPTASIVMPNAAAGVGLFTQAFCVAPTSPGLFLHGSNGRFTTVPVTSPEGDNGVTRLWSGIGGTTSAIDVGMIGYGLVTRFTHL